jgi:hypothetical protein
MAAADATAFAERLLAELNIKPNEIRKLQEMPFDQVQEAAKKLLPGRSPRGMADYFRPQRHSEMGAVQHPESRDNDTRCPLPYGH